MWDDYDDPFERGRYQSPEQLLWRAVRKGDAASVAEVLAKNNDGFLNLKCRHEDETLVYYALKRGYYDVAETLLKGGADVNAPSGHFEYTPFIFACNKGDTKAIDLLVKYNADVNARTTDKETALHRAAWRGDSALVERLVDEFGCDVNAQNYLGQTAIFCAVSANHPDTIKTLITLGADSAIQGSNGFSNLTPRDFANTIEQRQEVAATLDDPSLHAAAKDKIYQPVTRRPISVGKPLAFKLKPPSATFSRLG